MTDSNGFNLNKPGQNDPLQEVLREDVRKMQAAAIESEVVSFIDQCDGLKTDEGKAAAVRNGYLPERSIQNELGDIEVKVPKVRDRSGSGIRFNSSLIPPYLKRTRSIEEFLPWLYLRGVSTGDFTETLKHLLGADAPGLQCLAKNKDSMLAFYDYPAENWQHIKTTSPIESVLATVRLRTARAKKLKAG